MNPPSDPITAVETAYALDGDDDAWLARVAGALGPDLDDGLGIIAFRYDASDPRRFVWSEPVIASRGDEQRETLAAVNARLPAEFVLRLFGGGPGLTTVSEATGLRDRLGELPLVRELGHTRGAYDVVGLRIADPTARGALVMAPLRSIRAVPETLLHPWGQLAAHVAAGLRLRRTIAAVPEPEAVLSPEGTVVHAEAAARSNDARERLRAAVRAAERARGPLRRLDPQDALDAWRGLVAGRWSIVDHIDTDGRRFVVARRNDPALPDPRGLTPREGLVLRCVGDGHSVKLVAYELGLASSTVSTHLHAAMRKLGLRSRADVVRFVAGLSRAEVARVERDAPPATARPGSPAD